MKNEKGFTFVGVIIALGIMGVIAVAFLGGLATASRSLFTADELETANNLAESQMEYVKNQPYDTSYSPSQSILDKYEGYSATIVSEPLEDGNKQKITITIEHYSDEVATLEDYKVN